MATGKSRVRSGTTAAQLLGITRKLVSISLSAPTEDVYSRRDAWLIAAPTMKCLAQLLNADGDFARIASAERTGKQPHGETFQFFQLDLSDWKG